MFNTMSLTGTSAQINNSTIRNYLCWNGSQFLFVYFKYSIQTIDKKKKANLMNNQKDTFQF